MPRTPLGRAAAALTLLTIGLFALASATHTATHGASYVAATVGWFGSQLCLLALAGTGVTAAVTAVRRKRGVGAR